MSEPEIRCELAAKLIGRRLDKLEYGNDLLRLVQFSHDSPGLRDLRRKISRALILLLESNPDVVQEVAREFAILEAQL